jgi:hypothetical protein
MMSEEVEIEEIEEITEKAPEKQPEETIKECPPGQEWDEVIKRCVLSTVEITGSLEGETEITGSETITEEEAGLTETETSGSQYQKEEHEEEIEYIDPNLPSTYKLASISPLYRSGTEGMINCSNCSFHSNNQCSKWDATVKATSDTPFVCGDWKQIDTVSSSRYKLLSAAYMHEDLGLYGSYESRFGSSNDKAIYLFKADSDTSIPQVPNPDVNKRYKYSGSWVTVPGFGATSSDYSLAAQQVLKQLNDKNPGKWSLI